MVGTVRRLVGGSVVAATAILISAAPAAAHECVNANKNQTAGVQVVIDISTYIVGPEMEIPQQAQSNGPACQGITNVGVFFTECIA